MRISTSMIYDRGVGAIQNQWKNILHTQQQVSTGRRVLARRRSDRLCASARDRPDQGGQQPVRENIGYADDAMKLLESRLQSAGDVLHYVRERAVQAGNGAMAPEDLRYMATDMKAQFEAMLALANSQDGTGDYIFGGHRSQQQPYDGGLSGVSYNGDQGERTIQVSASRYMPVSLPGSDVFDRTLALNPDTVKLYAKPDNAGQGGRPSAPSIRRWRIRQHVISSSYTDGTPGSYEVTKLGQDGTEVAMAPSTFPAGGSVTIEGITFDLSASTVESGDAFGGLRPLDQPAQQHGDVRLRAGEPRGFRHGGRRRLCPRDLRRRAGEHPQDPRPDRLAAYRNRSARQSRQRSRPAVRPPCPACRTWITPKRFRA
ncbi:flagellar hook-associated protein FlgL [Thauera humireducens]|uniref:flagellar hook-associated protein FlgL n=1 Tax=Thauera humireducens TaxID=1134435 RepID=UPI00311F5458